MGEMVPYWAAGLLCCGIHGSEVEKRLVCYWVVFIRSEYISHIQLYPNPDNFFIVNQTHI